MLTDAGPLVALVDRRDEHHDRCRRALSKLNLPLVTTMAAITESFHIVRDRAGVHAQRSIWAMLRAGDVAVEPMEMAEVLAAADLMERYADQPMDFADATLMVLAERMKARAVFSLDKHFHVYRLSNGKTLGVFPE